MPTVFQIIAMVYVIVANNPAGEPIRVGHNTSFDSLAACQTYLKGDQFGDERQELAAFVKAQAQMKLAMAGKDDDEVPEVSVAVTASCEQDNRL